MKAPVKPSSQQTVLLVAALATFAGLLVPILRQALLPVQYLNTHLHELSHALVAQFTGADVKEIVVRANGSGETPVAGGNLLLIASAGYLGSSIFGAAMIFFGRLEKHARATLIGLTLLLAFSMVIWVRGDAIGEVSGIGWIVALGGAALFLKGTGLVLFCQFLGLQQCLSSVQSVFTLLKISASMEVNSDASILQSATGIPSVVWALSWTAISIGLIAWTFRKSLLLSRHS